MNTKKIISVTAGLALAMSMVLAIPAFAQTNTSGSESNVSLHGQGYGQQGQGHTGGQGGMNRGQGMMRPGVSGTVTAVNGNIITINGRQGFGFTTPTVSYTIDDTKAIVRKNNATSTVSSIAVGDTIFAQGTITGTNVVATSIRDGVMTGMRGFGNPGMNGKPGMASSTPPVIGNGQPVVAGTVSVVSGNTLTVTTASNVIYTVTVDASNAKILQGQNTVAFSSIVVGNKVLVQGTVNGTSIVASTVIDQSGMPVGTTGS